MSLQPSSWIVKDLSSSALSIFVDTNVYPLEVLFRACYVFTDKCYLFLSTTDQPAVINVRFKRKLESADLQSIVGEFCNELINQRVRLDVANETRSIRELIVAQAFAEADLIDKSDCEASYLDDPRGIAITK
jgi:His-Xaa-Ser system protein HxsD